MLNRIVIIAAFLLVFSDLTNAAQQLSADAEISLLTCAPGEPLYSAFGHSAFRVRDPKLNIDRVYNYGTFDFDTPNFYLKFVRGYLNYKLSSYPFKYFHLEYVTEKRSIYEQVLNLNTIEKQKMFDFLENNALPQNQFYQYDFFYDNCATKIRDVAEIVLGDNLKFKIENNNLTFRDLLQAYLNDRPWNDFMLDLILAKPTDEIAKTREYMFLPDWVKFGFESAIVVNNNKIKPLVKSSYYIYQPPKNNNKINKLTTPISVFTFLAIVIAFISWFGMKRKKMYYGIDFILLLITGIIGIIVFFAWTATQHAATALNFNIWWAFPLHFFVAFIILIKPRWRLLKIYFGFTALALLILLAGWFFLPQELHIAAYPLAIIYAIRSALFYYIH